jgi:hypothetical protein
MFWVAVDEGRRDIPATSQTPDDEAGPRPQNMSGDVRLVIGLLSRTVLVQVVPLSVLPTQSCCHVLCADTEAAAARTMAAYFMFEVDTGRFGNERMLEWSCVFVSKSFTQRQPQYLFTVPHLHLPLSINLSATLLIRGPSYHQPTVHPSSQITMLRGSAWYQWLISLI